MAQNLVCSDGDGLKPLAHVTRMFKISHTVLYCSAVYPPNLSSDQLQDVFHQLGQNTVAQSGAQGQRADYYDLLSYHYMQQYLTITIKNYPYGKVSG